MDKITATGILGGNPKKGRAAADFYPTPPEVTQALLDFLQIPKTKTIWEPACGEGHMVQVMKNNGYRVYGTDIQRGYDFLTVDPMRSDWIITNPPFSLADEFVKHCICLDVPFALLLKSQYWHAKKRVGMFYAHRPSFILPLTWRPDFLWQNREPGTKGSPLMDVCWCIWDDKQDHQTIYMPLQKPAGRVMQ